MWDVVLIGGSDLLRRGLKLILEQSGIRIAADYASVEETKVREAESSAVIFLLIHGPGRRPVREEIHDLRRVDTESRIIVMLSRLAADELVEVFAAGGDGLVLEDISAQALHDSLTLIALGEKVFPSQLAALISNDRRAETLPLSPLTRRELEVVRRLAQGRSNKEIANELALALATVKVHVKSLLRKLGVHNRTQAAIWAIDVGLVAAPEVTVKEDDSLQDGPIPAKEVETFPGRAHGIAPERRKAPVQSCSDVAGSVSPTTLTVGARTRFGFGYGDARRRLFTDRMTKEE